MIYIRMCNVFFLGFLLILLNGCGSKQVLVKSENNSKAIFSFIFDDLNSSDVLVKNIFDEYNFKPSFALVSRKLNSETSVLYKSYYDQGISILSHSITHPKMSDSLSKEEVLNHELEFSKETIEKYGIQVKGFVTPSSYMHPNFLRLAENHYEYSFTNNSKGVFDKTVPKNALTRYGIEANISTEDHNIDSIKSRIDSAIENKELLVFYGHALPSNYKDKHGNSRVSSDDLRKILEYLKMKKENNECLVLTSDEAISEYYK